MTNHAIRQLTEAFMKFPGVGPKQAKRFVYYLLTLTPAARQELTQHIAALTHSVSQCHLCQRFFTNHSANVTVCQLCQSPDRNDEQLLVVEKDVDLDNVEKAGMYQGRYFVLGGLISILSPHPKQEVRADKLAERIKLGGESKGLKEVIMALSTNPQADHTIDWLKTFLAPKLEAYKIKLSTLGRGLSTGTELEYSDSDTLRSAWQNRH